MVACLVQAMLRITCGNAWCERQHRIQPIDIAKVWPYF